MQKDADPSTASTDIVIKVNAANFLTSTGSVVITTEDHVLSNGTTAQCYKIVTKNTPADHAMGPWCQHLALAPTKWKRLLFME